MGTKSLGLRLQKRRPIPFHFLQLQALKTTANHHKKIKSKNSRLLRIKKQKATRGLEWERSPSCAARDTQESQMENPAGARTQSRHISRFNAAVFLQRAVESRSGRRSALELCVWSTAAPAVWARERELQIHAGRGEGGGGMGRGALMSFPLSWSQIFTFSLFHLTSHRNCCGAPVINHWSIAQHFNYWRHPGYRRWVVVIIKWSSKNGSQIGV